MSLTPTLEEDTPPASPTHRQTAQDDVCCVCLEALRPEARGAQRAVPIPTCNRHGMHPQCMAQWRPQAGNPYNAPCAKTDITGTETQWAGCRSTMTNWQPSVLKKTSRLQHEGVEPKQHKYKSGTTLSALLPDKTHQSHQPPFTSRFLVAHGLPQSGMVPTRSRLWTYRVERCRSALLPAEGMQASLTGRPLGLARNSRAG